MKSPRVKTQLVVLACLAAVAACFAQQQYRFCVVTDDDKNRMVTKYCPMLKGDESRASCVYTNSRLDCLRLMMKDDADFGIFQVEDLLVAMKDTVGDFAVTHEIQHMRNEKFEYELVTVVRKSANITALQDLRDKKLCHPGYGNLNDWTDIEGKFLEARVVPQECESQYTVDENAIKSSSLYFKAACKAGPWVPDAAFDEELKKKYPNLCQLCDIPRICSMLDKYWGRTGPLYCLTDGFGDVAWARLDDTKYHFEPSPDTIFRLNSDEYEFLCDNGSRVPLNSSDPCTWLSRPWPVVLSRRNSAEGIQKMISSLKINQDSNWKNAIQQLLDSIRYDYVPLPIVKIPEDYLRTVPGFLSANTIVNCGRQLKLCTFNNEANVKCDWLKEAARSNGIKPDIQCVGSRSMQECMKLVQVGDADVMLVESEHITTAKREYGLISLLFEYVSSTNDMYNVAAVVRASSSIKEIADLRGKKACFPKYKSPGWNTAVASLKNLSLLPNICPYEKAVAEFFSEACVPELNETNFPLENLKSLCKDVSTMKKFSGENGALECLRMGKGDVAFVSLHTAFNETDGNDKSWTSLRHKLFKAVCMENATKECFLSWTVPGEIMVRFDMPPAQMQEVKMTFLRISNLLGTNVKFQKPIFQMFSPFNGHKDILFHDTTEYFQDIKALPANKKLPTYEDTIKEIQVCSSGFINSPLRYISLIIIWLHAWWHFLV